MPSRSPLKGLTSSALHRRRAEVLGVAEAAPDAVTMLRVTSAAVARYVPSDAHGWSAADPGIILPTWPMYLRNVAIKDNNRFWEREFLVEDHLLFRDLASREVPVGRLHKETAGLPARSSRYRETLSTQQFGDELRAVLRVSGTVWGLLDLVRYDDNELFSQVEESFIASLVEPLASTLRAKVMRGPSDTPVTVNGTGFLLFDADGALTSRNDAAGDWLREMPNLVAEPDTLPSPVRAVLAYAHAVDMGQQPGPARVRVRVRSGQWVVLDASSIRTSEGTLQGTAVMIAPASSAEMASIFVSAYDLSAREQEITTLLARGTSTAKVAADLRLSVFTVRDHIKSIFAKVGVSSRGELVATLFTQQFR